MPGESCTHDVQPAHHTPRLMFRALCAPRGATRMAAGTADRSGAGPTDPTRCQSRWRRCEVSARKVARACWPWSRRCHNHMRIALVAVLLAGCPDRRVSELEPAPAGAIIKDIPLSADLDLLFVIDNSASTGDKQQLFRDNF